MKTSLTRGLGILIFLSVIGAVAGWKWLQRDTGPAAAAHGRAVTLRGKIGGEKAAFLESAAVRDALARSGLTLDVQKSGSVEMVRDPVEHLQFLWPASQMNVESFRELGGAAVQSEEIFHSPLVLYSWDVVTDVLIANRIVENQGGTYYVTDLARLVQLIDEKKRWRELGLTNLHAAVLIHTTDPARSNSGYMWAALLASAYNGGDVPTAERAEAIEPKLKAMFDRLGFMEASSGTLFDKFLKQGAGAYPIIAAYENQLLEFAIEHRELIEPVRRRLRVLYPRPTVWASHPLLALQDDAKRLVAALKSPALQRLAWERHGFRAGLMGEVPVADLPLLGVPATIDAVIPMPSPSAMLRLTAGMGGGPR